MKHRHLVVAVATACALGVTACGSSSNSSSGTSSNSSNKTSTASGSPVKLMTIGPTDAPGFSLPSLPVGAEVAIDEINKAGGLGGHPLQLITCNDKNNPNAATQCARQAIKEKVAAVVGGLSVFDLKAIPPLEQAGIPWIGNTTPDAYTQKNLFLIGGEGTPGLAAIGIALAEQGCKKVATVISAQGFDVQAQQIGAGVAAQGGAKVVKSVKAPANSTDFAPLVAGIRAAGADCIGAGTGPTETPALIKAINAGKKLKLIVLSGGLPDVVLKQLGASADGVQAVAGYVPTSSTDGAMPQLRTAAQAKAPKAPLDQFTQSGYASVKIVQEASKGLKDITASTLMAALPRVSGFDTGVGPVVTLDPPNPVPAFARIFNPKILLYKAANGNFTLGQADPIDTQPALKLMGTK